uniref:Uncharacterized protein n=1 Tax=Anopheles epiroticus TaxID=199890 RepID=A0A182P792_9DIPT
MASNSLVNQSADDGIPLDFLAEMHVAMDCLPVDEEEANRLLRQTELQAERVKQFNEAWNIQPIATEGETVTRRVVAPSIVSPNGNQESVNVRDPRLLASHKTQTTTGKQSETGASGSNSRKQQYQYQQQFNTVPLQTQESFLFNPTSEGRTFEQLPASYPNDEEDAGGRSSRNGRTRARGHGSRRRSRSQSRSPTHRRRKRRTRSRSRHRSPSYSSSGSSSRSSDCSDGTLDSQERPSRRSRRHRSGRSAMMKSMMSMVMQMVNTGMLAVPGGAPAAAPVLQNKATELTPAAFRSMFAHSRNDSAEVINGSDGSGFLTAVSGQNESSNKPKYDASTELFLDGKLSFADFLALKPSTRSDLMAKFDPKVPKRINEAISVLDQQDTTQQSARFLYVPPTYYNIDREQVTNRSPLIWNSHNVLFESTSRSKEAKNCQPFKNLNPKLKALIGKLGLDEGLVSQQLEKVKQAAALQKDVDGSSASATAPSTSGIQAITVLPPKPGTGKVRHLIDRETQTDGYACIDCVVRKNKTIISSSTQTAPPALRRNMEVQTSGPSLAGSNVLSLDGLNANQIETIEAIVRFIRNRQLAGSIESVQHALRNDRVTAAGMTPAIQHNAQKLLSQVKADLQRAGTFPSGSGGSSSNTSSSSAHYSSFLHHHQQLPPPPSSIPQLYEQQLRDLRMGNRRGSGITRTFHTTSVSEQIFPACFDSDPPLSKKSKKKAKQQQLQHHYGENVRKFKNNQ